MNKLICPECRGRVYLGTPIDLTPSQRAKPPRYHHNDGTQLCPVVGKQGYQAAEPVKEDR